MLTLRPYKKEDAKTVLSWIKDERAFRLWCADRFDDFPLSEEKLNEIYSDNDYSGMIALDGNEVIGHFFIQDLKHDSYKFGLIIVDSTKRGKGYGKKMLLTALDYAKNTLKAKRVVLAAFDTNPAAYCCYRGLGFKNTGKTTEYTFFNEKHSYIELEYFI
ncbi:MAG: GNAT family N-acetyltransferase [Clostridia bacterium]|nr:GNAT family N-acetyltransferase [Clostridia bacterium]